MATQDDQVREGKILILATETCANVEPTWNEIEPGRRVACHEVTSPDVDVQSVLVNRQHRIDYKEKLKAW